MRLAVPLAIAALALSVSANAQDTRTKSRTEIKADDAKVTTLTGCLRPQLSAGVYALDGTIAASGKEIETNAKVKTDVDNDKTTVKGKSETKVEDGAVATTGSTSTFLLVPGSSSTIDLASHVGEKVSVTAIMVKPGSGDADVKIKDRTKVDPEDAPDSKAKTTTKLELPRSNAGQYTVMTLTPTGTPCVP